MSNSNIVQGTLVVGRISAVFGVRGWVKVMSFTEQTSKIFDYQPWLVDKEGRLESCLLYTSPSPRDRSLSRMPSSA